MKILIRTRGDRSELLLVMLRAERVIKDVKRFAGEGRYAKAVVAALAGSEFIKAVEMGEVSKTEACLILTEEQAYFSHH